MSGCQLKDKEGIEGENNLLTIQVRTKLRQKSPKQNPTFTMLLICLRLSMYPSINV